MYNMKILFLKNVHMCWVIKLVYNIEQAFQLSCVDHADLKCKVSYSYKQLL